MTNTPLRYRTLSRGLIWILASGVFALAVRTLLPPIKVVVPPSEIHAIQQSSPAQRAIFPSDVWLQHHLRSIQPNPRQTPEISQPIEAFDNWLDRYQQSIDQITREELLDLGHISHRTPIGAEIPDSSRSRSGPCNRGALRSETATPLAHS